MTPQRFRALSVFASPQIWKWLWFRWGQAHHRPTVTGENPICGVGNTTQSMPSEECNRLIFERMHKEHRWENQTVDGFTVDDLDIEEIQNTVAEAVSIGRLNEPASRNAEDMLRALGLLQHGRLTRAAMVLFGRAERLESELPQCSVRVARFRGVDRSEVLDNRQIYGNAFSQLSSAMRFLSEWLPLAVRLEFRVWVH